MNIYYWQSTVLKTKGSARSWKVYGLILGKQACLTRGQWAIYLVYLACGPLQRVWHAWARMLHSLGVTNEGEHRWENQATEEHFTSSALGPSPAFPSEHWRIPCSFLLSAHSVEPPAKATQATPLAGPCVQQTEGKKTCPGETGGCPGRLQSCAGRLSSCTSQAQSLSLWKTLSWQISGFWSQTPMVVLPALPGLSFWGWWVSLDSEAPPPENDHTGALCALFMKESPVAGTS